MERDIDVERVNPLQDVVWSCLFQDMRGAPAMKELINAVLMSEKEDPIEEIISMSSQYPTLAEHPHEKAGRLDVRVATKKNEQFDIEVQLGEQDYFMSRELFYGERLLTEGFEAGKSYQDLPLVRIIAFLDFVMRPKHPDIVQPVGMHYSKLPLEAVSDKLWMYNVELPKFREQYGNLDNVSENADPLIQWLYILTKGYESEKEMEQLEVRTEGMANFNKLYTSAMADPTLRRTMRYVESARMEEASKLQAATDKGLAQGRAEGRAEGRAQGRAEGLAHGREEQGKRSALAFKGIVSDEEIAKKLGFPLSTIQAWYAEAEKDQSHG